MLMLLYCVRGGAGGGWGGVICSFAIGVVGSEISSPRRQLFVAVQIDLSEEDPHTKLAETDLITKDDSDEEDSEGTTDESGQDNMLEGEPCELQFSLLPKLPKLFMPKTTSIPFSALSY